MADRAQFDHGDYDAVLFIDSMIPLEGRPLPELPWGELNLGSRILLLVVPQVLQEVDKRKRDGRLAKRAREFRRLVEPAAIAGTSIRVTDGPPSIDLALAPSARIDWNRLDDFDPEEGDAKVVAQVLFERCVPDERKVLFSQDMLPMALASRHGLAVRRFPDEWLAPAEPSPHDREMAKLKARVRELEAAEPDIKVDVLFGVTPPFELPVLEPLSRDEQSEFYEHLLRANPRQRQANPGLMAPVFGYDAEYEGRYQKFVHETLPAYTRGFHKLVQDYYAQISLRLTIVNDGAVQAENLVVELRATGGGLREKFLVQPLSRPSAPKVQSQSDFITRNMPIINPRDFRTPIVGRHEVAFETEADGGVYAEIHCADFRHGRRWGWNGIAHLDSTADQFIIEATLTASNMKGKRVETFALPVKSRSVRVAQVVDPIKREYTVRYPLQERFEEALESKDMDWLEFVEYDPNLVTEST